MTESDGGQCLDVNNETGKEISRRNIRDASRSDQIEKRKCKIDAKIGDEKESEKTGPRQPEQAVIEVLQEGLLDADATGFDGPILKGRAHAPSTSRTAMVNRLIQTSLLSELRIRISQSCVVRPTWIGSARPVTMPELTERTWFALISKPTQRNRPGSRPD